MNCWIVAPNAIAIYPLCAAPTKNPTSFIRIVLHNAEILNDAPTPVEVRVDMSTGLKPFRNVTNRGRRARTWNFHMPMLNEREQRVSQTARRYNLHSVSPQSHNEGIPLKNLKGSTSNSMFQCFLIHVCHIHWNVRNIFSILMLLLLLAGFSINHRKYSLRVGFCYASVV